MKEQAGLILLSSLVVMALAAYWLNQIERKTMAYENGGESVERKAALAWPIHHDDYVALSSPFGERDISETGGYGDGFHDGVDMYGTYSARITCVDDGEVLEHWPAPNGHYKGHPVLGGLLVVQHDGFISRYAHLSKTYVQQGDRVGKGQVIGRQGETGRTASQHLHFEIEIDGVRVNPLQYLAEPDKRKQGE